MTNLTPDLFVDNLFDIPLDKIKELGIKALIIDLDNTITEWNSHFLSEETYAWFEQLKEQGFKTCLLSNNGEQRVLAVAKNLDIQYVYRAQKPRRSGFERALKIMGVDARHTAVVGDQIFTDIWGGNRSGLYTILVKPLSWREFVGTKFSRFLEYFVLRRLRKKRLVKTSPDVSGRH